VPDSGDVVWLNFTPHAGHEQAGYRPALVKNHPFEVRLAGNLASVVLADQVKSVDWRARKAVRKGKAAPAELAEVRAKIRALIG